MFHAGHAGLFQALTHGAARTVKFNPQRIIRDAEIVSDN